MSDWNWDWSKTRTTTATTTMTTCGRLAEGLRKGAVAEAFSAGRRRQKRGIPPPEAEDDANDEDDEEVAMMCKVLRHGLGVYCGCDTRDEEARRAEERAAEEVEETTATERHPAFSVCAREYQDDGDENVGVGGRAPPPSPSYYDPYEIVSGTEIGNLTGFYPNCAFYDLFVLPSFAPPGGGSDDAGCDEGRAAAAAACPCVGGGG